MTTYVAEFDRESVRRTSERVYTHASRRPNGDVSFHGTYESAKRSAGPYGEVVRVGADMPYEREQEVVTEDWAVYTADGTYVGIYKIAKGSSPVQAIKAAWAEGKDADKARPV